MEEKPLVSVVMPVFNQIEFTIKAFASFKANTEIPFELILVDNASTDGTKEIMGFLPGVKMIRNETNEGFVKAVNKGIEASQGKYIVIANNDIVVSKNWLEKMVEVAEDYSKAGIISLITTDGGKNQNIVAHEIPELQGMKITSDLTDKINKIMEDSFNGQIIEETNSIIFCLALIKREVIDKVGLLSEDFGIGFGDDGDYSIRARKAGFKLILRKDAFFFHFRRTTFTKLFTGEQILEMQKHNISILERKYPEIFEKLPARKIVSVDKKLKILITNNHLKNFGGSETFTYTMAKELKERGHNVSVFTLSKGGVSDMINEFCPVVDNPDEFYDLILVNHNSCLSRLSGVRGFKIFTSHGIYPDLEQPIEGADRYVAISEEVQKHLSNKGFESTVIHNGIDCRRFSSKKPINDKVTKILSLCQGKDAKDIVQEACDRLGIEVEFIGYPQNATFNVPEKINGSDLVIGLGRSAYEALACGRAVIVYDTRQYSQFKTADGIVTEGNINEMIKNNLSGRRFQLEWTVDNLIEEIKKYNPQMSLFNRRYALENLNIEKQIDKYLALKI